MAIGEHAYVLLRKGSDFGLNIVHKLYMQALRLSMTTILCNNSVAPLPFRTTRRPWCPTFQKVIFNRFAVSSSETAQYKDEIPLRGSLPPAGDTPSKPSPWPNSTVCCRFLGKIRYLSKKCLSLWQRKALNSRKICDSCPIYKKKTWVERLLYTILTIPFSSSRRKDTTFGEMWPSRAELLF